MPLLPSLQACNRLIIVTTKIVFLGHFVSEYIGEVRQTQGPSMLPTISFRNDWVYVDKTYRRGKGIVNGDVVAVKHPMFPGVGAIKRIVGMPGDFVGRDTPGSAATSTGRAMMIQVPEGHCFIMGDNVPFSRDSRDYGPIPLALIKGKVIARVLPLSEMKWIENTLQHVRKGNEPQ